MACFTLSDGRRTTRSTGTSEKREAQRIANHFEDVAKEGKAKKLTESRARKTIADTIPRANDVLRKVEGSARSTARRGFHGLMLKTDGPDAPDAQFASEISDNQ
jgi:hypothetical protein